HILTSDDAVNLERLPDKMIIVGSGAIGCEFATLFSAFGVKIILIELLSRILPLTPLPESIAQRVAVGLKRRGVEIITNAVISSLVVKDNLVQARLQTGQSISAEMALISIGRELNTNNIGLEDLGIKLGPKNAVIIDDFMRTNYPHIYAVGDITGRQQLAHLASRQGIMAAEHACGKIDLEPINYQAVPWCIFTEPPIGFVGASEQELQQKGIEYKVAEFPYQAIGVTYARGELEGRVWLIADKRTQRLLGGSIYGYSATELIHLVALGMVNSLTVKEMQRLICAHPTFAEVLGESLEALTFLPLHL
ncbi:MAG: NAD(P)/FAD-dependent oxidoreductase, partial [Candidatus Sumerlaeia bacterium]|nr:NAD(P)/FAD-dependent oxidoreductase [Candidatus Sumerlaeia bacterium]